LFRWETGKKDISISTTYSRISLYEM